MLAIVVLDFLFIKAIGSKAMGKEILIQNYCYFFKLFFYQLRLLTRALSVSISSRRTLSIFSF